MFILLGVGPLELEEEVHGGGGPRGQAMIRPAARGFTWRQELAVREGDEVIAVGGETLNPKRP